MRQLFSIGFAVILISWSYMAHAGGQTIAGKKTLNLSDCISLAQQNNPHFAAQAYDVAAAKARVAESRGALLPTIAGSGSYHRFSEFLPKSNLENYSADISIRQPLFQGGRLWSSLSRAKSNYFAADYQYETALQNLILDVQEAYYGLLQKQRLVGVAEKDVTQVKIHLDAARERFRLGLARRADVLKAEVELSNAKLNLIKAENAQLAARGQLNNVLGIPVTESIKIMDILGQVNAPESEAEPDSLIQQAERSRPELRRLQAQIQAQRAAVNVARSEYWPSFNADASSNWDGNASSELTHSWYVGLSLSIPLFNGLARHARVSEEQAQLQSLLKEQESLRQWVSLSVWNAYLKVKEAKERIENTRQLVKNARENLQIAEGEYKEGVCSMLELIDAQAARVTAEESHIGALADYQIARANLVRTLGIIRIKTRGESK